MSLCYYFASHLFNISDEYFGSEGMVEPNEVTDLFFGIPLRIVAATVGSLTVPLTYLILNSLECRDSRLSWGLCWFLLKMSLLPPVNMCQTPSQRFCLCSTMALLTFVQLSLRWWLATIYWPHVLLVIWYQAWWPLTDLPFKPIKAALIFLSQFIVIGSIPIFIVFGLCALHLSKISYISRAFEASLIDPPPLQPIDSTSILWKYSVAASS